MKRKVKLNTSSTEETAARKAYILQFAKNPLIKLNEIAELLGVSRAYVGQVVQKEPGLLEQRDADREKYFNNLRKTVRLPQIKL